MKGVELEFHQLVLRYERLKVVRPEAERRLLASLAEVGQQVPIVVVREDADGTFVVIDGYKRVRALRRLGRDAVTAGCWPGDEAEALIATRLTSSSNSTPPPSKASLIPSVGCSSGTLPRAQFTCRVAVLDTPRTGKM
jgi:hypothetical protein